MIVKKWSEIKKSSVYMDWCPPWYRIIFSVFTSRSLVTDERKCTKLSVIWNLTIPTSSPFCLGFSIYTKLPMNYSSPGEGNGNPLQYSCLAIPMDRGAWKAVVHGVASSQTGLSKLLSLFTFMHWWRQWQPTPVFLPGESQGWGSLVGCLLWGRTESDTTEVT